MPTGERIEEENKKLVSKPLARFTNKLLLPRRKEAKKNLSFLLKTISPFFALEECSSSSSEKEKEYESINYVKNPLINEVVGCSFFFSELKEAVSSEFLFPPDFFFSRERKH